MHGNGNYYYGGMHMGWWILLLSVWTDYPVRSLQRSCRDLDTARCRSRHLQDDSQRHRRHDCRDNSRTIRIREIIRFRAAI